MDRASLSIPLCTKAFGLCMLLGFAQDMPIHMREDFRLLLTGNRIVVQSDWGPL